MQRGKTGAWPYLSAATLALLVLFVFWALQNYGPESTIRRFHGVVAHICTYLPPEQPYDPRLLRREDYVELAHLTGGAQNSKSLAGLVDGVRGSIYFRQTFSIARNDYKTTRHTLVVVVYKSRKGEQNAAVYVVDKPDQSWIINAGDTALLLKNLNPRSRSMF